MSKLSQTIYTQLRDGVLTFIAHHPAPEMERFAAGVSGWAGADAPDEQWVGGEIALLPAAAHLHAALDQVTSETEPLVALFDRHRLSCKWEQSYRRRDGLVGGDMLDGYGFVEVIGKQGPFVSGQVRIGIGVWGPDIDYPEHAHAAEEIYVPLAGHASFSLGGGAYKRHGVGSCVHVSPHLPHGFRTTDAPFVVLYIWQNGDLRETSTFSSANAAPLRSSVGLRARNEMPISRS
ncbi:MAG: dimethylsulfonioproprionate lyase family protein [Pseudomonadota bacterium]